ncbi:MAG: extracellular solute-binding protein [Actinomycetota bacterium]
MRSLSRREFLRSSAAAAAGLSLGGSLLAACSTTRPKPRTSSIPLVRKENPVTWPISGDNPPIASGLEIEKGATLKVYQWREYLYEAVLDDFAKRFDVSFEVENYETIQEGVEGVRGPMRDFDVFFPTVEALGELVQSRMLLPLNHDYLPNTANLWPVFTRKGAPFYDVGERYSVPYTVYSTGIMWRRDLVDARIAPDNTGYDSIWDFGENVGVIDNYREGIGLALLRGGVQDVNTADPTLVERAVNHLIELHDVYVTAEGAYEDVPQGHTPISQAWSGDFFSAPFYGRSNVRRSAENLGYWWPKDGTGIAGNDLTSVLANGKNPVLAHAFVNHLMDTGVALKNFTWNGYQPPIRTLTKAWLRDCGDGAPGASAICFMYGPSADAVVEPDAFERSPMLLPLHPETDALWQSEWQRFLEHAEKT